TTAQPSTGSLIEVIGRKIGCFSFAWLWALINMAHALAGGWISLAFLRGLMGLTEAAALPAGITPSAEWGPSKEGSRAAGLV
ncbi:MFS transporter, partial [Salmonella enterica subsp. enterica serovar Wilhelmsburg]